MSRIYRALLLWLVTIAIPLQGMAAVVMPLCVTELPVAVSNGVLNRTAAKMLNEHSALADVKAPGQMLESGHGHGHGHAHGPAADGHGASSTATPDAGQSGHSGHSMLKCCSAACSMAVYFSPSVAKHSRMPSLAPEQVEATFCPDVFLDGLDRPPRSFPA